VEGNRYAHPGSLLDTGWLEGHLGDTDLRVIEIDENVTAYERGHIPGSIGWSWNTDLCAPVQRDFIDRERLGALLLASGVDAGSTVVLYGGSDNSFAAYAYWLLRYLGFDAVKLLNGGRRKWELESRPITDEVPCLREGTVTIEAPTRSELRVFRNQVLARLGRAVFVDVRSTKEFRGTMVAPPHLPREQAPVPGHIPGAANIPWRKALAGDGTFRPDDELRALYESAGVTPDREVITYCRTGVRSSHVWFVLHELLGYPDVKHYDGSWAEYGSLVREPVEKG
jgi:thiosulfate/3-mercaptopyruvate sulfurtransferase